MTQLGALVWLKWMLFRNSLRSRKAAVGRVASLLGTLAALTLALLIALGLGVAAYGIASLDESGVASNMARSEVFFLFMFFAGIYLMWATVPLSIGGGSQFDPGRLLLYPVSLRKLFALDFLSELTSLASIFAVPIVFAIVLGAGLGNGEVWKALVVAPFAIAFGLALAKWLGTSVGALMKKRRTRGETLLALVGAVAGLMGAFAGQLVPVIARHGDSFRGLRWTPPGAVAVALIDGLRTGGAADYALALATLALYTSGLIILTYWIARRAALGIGGAKRAAATQKETQAEGKFEQSAGWQLPLLSSGLSAIVEKELHYAMRNAQLRMVALMPLILIGFKFMQRGGPPEGRSLSDGATSFMERFALYGEGLLSAAGVLYVFMMLASLACNVFAYEEGGMRALILAPLERRVILIGKNIALIVIASVFASALLIVNQIVFRDLSFRALVFTAISFLIFASMFALIGNWLSIHFPKRMQFGKRMNVSGVSGLLLIPILIVMAIPPVAASLAGYLAQSLTVKYVTLAAFACVALALYFLLIVKQGRSLARREIEILEAVSGRTEN